MRAITTTTTSSSLQSKVSSQMRKLLAQLTDHIYGAAEIIVKINDQGKHDNLSKAEIRELINIAIGNALTKRQVRRLLPMELKYSEKVRDQSDRKSAVKMSANPNQEAIVDEIDNKYRKEFSNPSISSEQTAVMVEPKDFNPDRLWDYPVEFLIEVIRYLHKENLSLKEKLADIYKQTDLSAIPNKISNRNRDYPNKISNRNRDYISYEEASKYAHKVAQQGINSDRKWREHDKPDNIPRRPDKVYRDKWNGWGSFFGK